MCENQTWPFFFMARVFEHRGAVAGIKETWVPFLKGTFMR